MKFSGRLQLAVSSYDNKRATELRNCKITKFLAEIIVEEILIAFKGIKNEC
jgi:hypothetical protein